MVSVMLLQCLVSCFHMTLYLSETFRVRPRAALSFLLVHTLHSASPYALQHT